MKLSVPIYQLKRQAKALAKTQNLAHLAALNVVAQGQGYGSWSLLAAAHAEAIPVERLFDQLPRDGLAVVAARPGQGKTLLALRLLARAMEQGNRTWFFTLEFTAADCAGRLDKLNVDLARFPGLFTFDGSDGICAETISQALDSATPNSVVALDYLQLLDQDRSKPELNHQVRALRDLAKDRRLSILLLSQVDRSFPGKDGEAVPGWADLRLPNPLDLSLIDLGYFLHDGRTTTSRPPN